MMRKTGLVLMIFFACSFPHVNAQTGTKWPSTMLWRISGNNLQQPSYLFGTIHLQDKELFNFGDSVYRALSGVQGFAMEINPYEMMDLMMDQIINNDKDDEEENNDGPRKPPPPPGSKKSLGKSRFRIGAAYRKGKGEQMNTIVDLYLYETARTQGKWLGGLEDINDHIGYIMDETGSRAEKPDEDYKSPLAMNVRDSMVSWYVKQDLDRLFRAFDQNGQFDEEMNTRNAVMVRMADSLSHIRSTFFAVGTAHLPGEKGIITLLRSRGFTVTPVFSSKKITPKPLVSDPNTWPEIYEADSSYSYRMPYAPKVLKQGKTGVEMKISFDLSELMGYFFFSITDQAADANASNTYLIDRMLKNYESKRNKLSNTKHGQYMGHPSLTASMEEDGNEVRLRLVQDHNTLYVMLTSAEKNKNFKEERITFFFNSLRINKQVTVKPESWISYTDTANGYSITSPCQIKLKKIAGEDSTRVRLFNMCADSYTNTQYGITVVKMNPGYYGFTDTAFLQSFSGEIADMAKDKKVTVTPLTVQGYPAATYELTDENDLNYLFRIIIKGGIMYTVVTAGSDVHTPASMRFHESFRMTDAGEDHWKKQLHPDGNITLFAPAPFELVKPGEYDEDIIKNLHYYSFDPATATSYYLFKTPNNPYLWYKNDSAWAATIMPANNIERDSVISKKMYYESGRPVLELVKTCSMLNTWKHIKIFVAGDTMYELQSYVTIQQYQSAAHQRMYSNIELKKELPVTIFENKNSLIFNDLVTIDSLKFETAKDALGMVDFAPGELSLLHEALLKKYLPEDSTVFDFTVNRALINAILPLANRSTLDFIQQHYKNIPANISLKQEDLLYLLVKMKTTSSMKLFKELLIGHTPVKPGNRYLTGILRDSLLLCVPLFPEINRLLPDTNFQFLVISLENELIDSGLLSVSVLTAAEKDIYAVGRAEMNRLARDSNYYSTDISALLGLLAKLKTPEALKILNEYGRLKNEFVLFRLLSTQLQEKVPVNTVVLNKLAASELYRIDAYRELEKQKKEKQFPPAYATQQAFARSLMFSYYGEDDEAEWEIKKVQFVKEITDSYKGKPCRFFVFKVQILADEELMWYTGISGPFENDRKKLYPLVDYGSEWLDLDDTYKPANIPLSLKSFKARLKRLEEE